MQWCVHRWRNGNSIKRASLPDGTDAGALRLAQHHSCTDAGGLALCKNEQATGRTFRGCHIYPGHFYSCLAMFLLCSVAVPLHHGEHICSRKRVFKGPKYLLLRAEEFQNQWMHFLKYAACIGSSVILNGGSLPRNEAKHVSCIQLFAQP